MARLPRQRGVRVKVKLFIKDKSPFRRWARFVADLEDEVNTWLAAHPDIRIAHVTQSSNGGSLDTSKVWLSVWYEENPSEEYPDHAYPQETALRPGPPGPAR